MPKKKADKEKPGDEKSVHLKRLESTLTTNQHRREWDQIRRSRTAGIIYSGTIYSGTTKTWLNDSRRCRTLPHRYPQLVELPTYSISYEYRSPNMWNPPPPGLENINRLVEYAPRYNTSLWNFHIVVTGVSDPAIMVSYCPSSEQERIGKKRRLMTHKSTEIDPFSASNQVLEFSYVIRSRDGKYYALSSQGAFVMMEETLSRDGNHIFVTGISGTRAVPSSGAKFFREYLFESRGEILIAFLIFKDSTWGLADEIEVYRFDFDTLKLVRVESLRGRALFLENNCCVWVDSEDVGCKDDCVYFTGGSGDGWWMYDMKTRSISDECVDISANNN